MKLPQRIYIRPFAADLSPSDRDFLKNAGIDAGDMLDQILDHMIPDITREERQFLHSLPDVQRTPLPDLFEMIRRRRLKP